MSATISSVAENSPAHEAGLRKGDILLEMNGRPIRDVIDCMFYSRGDTLALKVQRENETMKLRARKKEKADFGFELKPFRVRSCRNKCVFCFLHQLPKGLRRSLYVKDDDYRLSFLHGNYITLTNISVSDKKRIFSQRLSPLYISVHSTNSDIRRKILGNPKAPDILREIQEFTSQRIRVHAQVVLCPGLNDGEELIRTIKDLQKFYPYMASIAVVPVGMTKYKKTGIQPIDKGSAARVIEDIELMRKRFKRRHGDPLVYLADEFYILANAPFPPLRDYGDLSQVENGVGMVSLFLNTAKKLKIPKRIEPRNVAVFTGTAFAPYLEEFAVKLRRIEGLTLDIFVIENRLFGHSVTVTGLLPGRDVLKALVGKTEADFLLVPDVALRNGKDVFLDNVTLKDMEESLGIHVLPIESTPAGLLKGIENGVKRKN